MTSHTTSVFKIVDLHFLPELSLWQLAILGTIAIIIYYRPVIRDLLTRHSNQKASENDSTEPFQKEHRCNDEQDD